MDAAALERLRQHFPRPREPMGEAWFMGSSRRMFGELQGDIARLSPRELQGPLTEIASGTSCFGPRQEWTDWYHHLLAPLLPRSHESFVSYLLESLVTGFMTLYPNGIHASPYPEFQDDMLRTLGRCMMDAGCWQGQDIAVGSMLHCSNEHPREVWGWWDASGDFSASMFFCLKYLPEAQVEGWLRSVLAIPSPHWRAQLMVWAVGARGLLRGDQRWPSELEEHGRSVVVWEWSHALKPELAAADTSDAPRMDSLLPPGNRSRALEVLSAWFAEDSWPDWLASLARFPYLESELGELPAAFEACYVPPRPRSAYPRVA